LRAQNLLFQHTEAGAMAQVLQKRQCLESVMMLQSSFDTTFEVAEQSGQLIARRLLRGERAHSLRERTVQNV
jgi:hypothetical protein